MKEYNFTFDDNTMMRVLGTLLCCMENNVYLKAGDSTAILKLFELKQIKHFLGIIDFPLWQDSGRILGKGKDFKESHLAKEVKHLKFKLCVAAAGHALLPLVEVLHLHILDHCSLKEIKHIFVDMLLNVSYAKQQLYMITWVISYFQIAGIPQNESKRICQAVLRMCMFEPLSGSDCFQAVDAITVLRFMILGITPDIMDAANCAINFLANPVLGLENEYDEDDTLADLSSIFAFEKLVNVLFNKLLRQKPEFADKVFKIIVKGVLKLMRNGPIWLNGLIYLKKVAVEAFPHLQTEINENELAYYKFVSGIEDQVKWNMSIGDNGDKVRMRRRNYLAK